MQKHLLSRLFAGTHPSEIPRVSGVVFFWDKLHPWHLTNGYPQMMLSGKGDSFYGYFFSYVWSTLNFSGIFPGRTKNEQELTEQLGRFGSFKNLDIWNDSMYFVFLFSVDMWVCWSMLLKILCCTPHSVEIFNSKNPEKVMFSKTMKSPNWGLKL